MIPLEASLTEAIEGAILQAMKAPNNSQLPARTDVSTDAPSPSDPAEQLQELWKAIQHLEGDSHYILEAITEYITARHIPQNLISVDQRRFLISSGTITDERLATIDRSIERGSLVIRETESFLSRILASISLDDTIGYLAWDETSVRSAVAEGRLTAFEVSGRLRFPTSQFTHRADKIVPGLATLLDVVGSRWSHATLAGFMGTPKAGLVAEAQLSPAAWLLAGHSLSEVIRLIEAADRG